jgi:hypothetical protein
MTLHIRRFIDKMAVLDARQARDLVLPLAEARSLRDEVLKLMADNYALMNTTKSEEVIQVEITGGKFR